METSYSRSTAACILLNQLGLYYCAQNVAVRLLAPPSLPIDQAAYEVPKDDMQAVQLAGEEERRLWEEVWLDCARHLGQWDMIADFGGVQRNLRLIQQSCWKIGEWRRMKDATLKNVNQETLWSTLYQSYVCCHDVKPVEVENRYRNCVQLALKQWNGLPSLYPTSISSGRSTDRWLQLIAPRAHWELLCQFQQVVEIHDSAKILKELHSVRAPPPTTPPPGPSPSSRRSSPRGANGSPTRGTTSSCGRTFWPGGVTCSPV